MPLQEGWLDSAQICRSEHFNARPDGEAVSLLVVHNISLPPGQFGGGHVQRFFCGQLDSSLHPYFTQISELRVSAHFLIERSGIITQFVNCDQRAWHAGASSYAGRAECNDFSIGIELEGADQTAYTDAQYDALSELTKALQVAYPAITPCRVTGHEFIAPGRKTDPGVAFDWRRYLSSLVCASPNP